VDLQLEGRTAVVTGGSGVLGSAIAAQLAREGCRVCLVARNPDRLQARVDGIEEATGASALYVCADTSSTISVQAMAEEATARLGPVEILVNCAARPTPSTVPRLADIDECELLGELDVKALGYLRCAQAFAPAMVVRGWGRIVNIGGLAALSTGSIVSSVRNSAVIALTKNLADELGPDGVTAVSVNPGRVQSQEQPIDEAVAGRLARRSSIGRLVDATEIADLVAFLASPRSAALNGAAISCGGGTRGEIRY
jgi:NAD(P)-dependent dehydrogenase (short-subunit alcohol dehydrogenase family)